MKLIAYIVMTLCLTLGTISAVTAYSPPLSLADEKLEGLTLNADAGKVGEGDDARPIATQNEVLDAELVGTLREAGVKRVRVKEFSLARWDLLWLMGLSIIGLFGAAMLVKWKTRQEIAAELAADAGAVPTETPEHAVAEIAKTVARVHAGLEGAGSDHDKAHMIIEEFGGLQWTHIQAILDARSKLIARLGLGGFAEFMDAFSRLERLLNRAWSAAADGVLAEADLCVNEAAAQAPIVEQKLR